MINLIGEQIEPYRQNMKLNENQFFLIIKKKKLKQNVKWVT